MQVKASLIIAIFALNTTFLSLASEAIPSKQVLIVDFSNEEKGSLSYGFPLCASPNKQYGLYPRALRENISSLKREIKQNYIYSELSSKEKHEEKTVQTGKKNIVYTLSHYHESPEKDATAEAAYFIINKHLVGHLLLKREYIMQDLSYCWANDEFSLIKESIRKMTSLPLTRIPLPRSGETLELYALNHDGYTEQYGFIRHEGHLYWVLDGFYPEDFKKEYTRKALKSIDDFIAEKHWLFPEPEYYKVD